MTFTDRIEALGQKPPRTRIAVLIAIVLVVMAGIIGIWVLQLQYELNGTKDAGQAPSLFSSLWQSIRDTIKKPQ